MRRALKKRSWVEQILKRKTNRSLISSEFLVTSIFYRALLTNYDNFYTRWIEENPDKANANAEEEDIEYDADGNPILKKKVSIPHWTWFLND